MARVIEQVVKKTRYISVRLSGEEVYVENISTQGDLRYAVPAGKLRLREIQKVMPLGDWSLHPVRNSTRLCGCEFLTG